MDPSLLTGIASMLISVFQYANSGNASSSALTLQQQQQQQEASLMKQKEQERANTQVQIGQNAETAKAAAAKAMMGPKDAGFGASLLQPVGNATNPSKVGAGKPLFGL